MLVIFWATAALCAFGQETRTDTLHLQVYFRRNVSVVEPEYRGNGSTLEAFRDSLNAWLADPDARVQDITIRTSASPEGSVASNQLLSENRARGIENYLSGTLGIKSKNIQYQPVGEDWEGLRAAIAGIDQPWRDEALEIMNDKKLRKKRLMDLKGGKVWWWLDENVFPDLRAGGGAISCVVQRPAVHRVDTVYIYVRDTVAAEPQVVVQEVIVPAPVPVTVVDSFPAGRRMLFALRTNALAIPFANFGVEVPLSRRWSVAADYYYPWIWRQYHKTGLDYQGYCNEMLAWDIEGRYWFPGKNVRPTERLLGHSIGLYAAGGYYDFERNFTGHQGWYYNIGADYLYAVPIFRRRAHLEFELGIGFIHSAAQPFDTYVAGDKAYRRKGVTKYVNWFGPTRAGISLVIPIYTKIKEGREK